jgi:hypothetical protein
MAESSFNRQSRRSGDARPAGFSLPNLSPQDLEIVKQEAVVRSQHGEAGVRLCWERIPDSETDN